MPRRRTPNHLKVAKGTDTPARMRDEPDFALVDGYPEAPDYLINPDAVEEWDHKVRILSDAGVLTEASLSTLAKYCNMHADCLKQWRAGMKPTAAELTQVRMMATEFGFTPASSSKVGGGAKKEANKFASLGVKAG